MTEQELLKKIGTLTTPEHLLECAKAYADARVAQECKVLDETVTLLHQTIADRNVAIAELKASLNTAQQMYTDLLAGTTDAINAKDAEIKRLRDALIDIEDDAHAKMVLGTPLNTKSILMSARHGLGIDSEMIHPQNKEQE